MGWDVQKPNFPKGTIPPLQVLTAHCSVSGRRAPHVCPGGDLLQPRGADATPGRPLQLAAVPGKKGSEGTPDWGVVRSVAQKKLSTPWVPHVGDHF